MKRELAFNKALRLLDMGREEDALSILADILAESQREKDAIHVIRSSCVLGQYYYNTGRMPEAREHLEMVLCTTVPGEQNDTLDYERNVAKELLRSM